MDRIEQDQIYRLYRFTLKEICGTQRTDGAETTQFGNHKMQTQTA